MGLHEMQMGVSQEDLEASGSLGRAPDMPTAEETLLQETLLAGSKHRPMILMKFEVAIT